MSTELPLSTRILCTLLLASYHGLDNQCIAVRMAHVSGVSLTEGDIFRLTSSLLGRPLVGRPHGHNRPFPGLSEVAVLGSLRLPSEVQSAEDGSNFARTSCLVLVLMGLSAPIADVVLEVSFPDKLLNLVFEGDAFFRGVADISVKSTIFILVPLRAVSSHRIWSFIQSRVLRDQEYILTRPHQVGEVIVLTRRGSRDPLIQALGLLLVGVWRSSAIFAFTFLTIPVLLSRHEFFYWCDLMWCFYRS